MIDLDGVYQPLPQILSDVTDDGHTHSLYYVIEHSTHKHALGVLQRNSGRWVFKAFKNQQFDSDELWLIMRYMVELTYTEMNQEIR